MKQIVLDEWERLAEAARIENEEPDSVVKGPAAWAFIAFTTPSRVLEAIYELREGYRNMDSYPS
jgi:hypothetical protein